VKARGYSTSFDGHSVTAESEIFSLGGELETSDPTSPLLKLGHGQAVPGMSGAPVLDVGSGEVIGMLRTSRDVSSDLGAWVVPAGVIRQLWPHEVSVGNDRYHLHDSRWHLASLAARRQSSAARSNSAPASAQGTVIGHIGADAVTAITGGHFTGPVNINMQGSGRRDGER
jgi:hypothetical protein